MARFFCSDPTEARLRQAWHDARSAMDAEYTPDNVREFHEAHATLSRYLWSRVEADIAEDRKRHPKAKRNQPKPADTDLHKPGARALP